MNQYQMYEKARRENAELIKDVAFLCGMLGDNPNPLTDQEIINNANSGKSYSWAFKPIAESILDQRKKAKTDRYLAVIKRAQRLYTRNGVLPLYRGGLATPYTRLEQKAWDKYMASSKGGRHD